MTMRTKDPIVCECGHKGYVKCSENDQPFSKMYESYSLEGFDGGSFTVTNSIDVDIIARLNPRCPNCAQTGKVKFE
jgi:hypothetical protein